MDRPFPKGRDAAEVCGAVVLGNAPQATGPNFFTGDCTEWRATMEYILGLAVLFQALTILISVFRKK